MNEAIQAQNHEENEKGTDPRLRSSRKGDVGRWINQAEVEHGENSDVVKGYLFQWAADFLADGLVEEAEECLIDCLGRFDGSSLINSGSSGAVKTALGLVYLRQSRLWESQETLFSALDALEDAGCAEAYWSCMDGLLTLSQRFIENGVPHDAAIILKRMLKSAGGCHISSADRSIVSRAMRYLTEVKALERKRTGQASPLYTGTDEFTEASHEIFEELGPVMLYERALEVKEVDIEEARVLLETAGELTLADPRRKAVMSMLIHIELAAIHLEEGNGWDVMGHTGAALMSTADVTLKRDPPARLMTLQAAVEIESAQEREKSAQIWEKAALRIVKELENIRKEWWFDHNERFFAVWKATEESQDQSS